MSTNGSLYLSFYVALPSTGDGPDVALPLVQEEDGLNTVGWKPSPSMHMIICLQDGAKEVQCVE